MGSLGKMTTPSLPKTRRLHRTVPMLLRKAAAEHLVSAAHHTFGLDTVITRCGNNYGPRQFPEKFLPLVFQTQ